VQDWVAVSYDGNWHVGQITDFDDKDGEFEIKFLRKTRGKTNNKPTFKWPAPDDILDISIDQIICIVREPTLFGRSGRCFVLEEGEYERIVQKFDK